MSKRFIDTELFNDSWFIDLDKDVKLTYIYLITRCNHAGIIEISRKLFKLQTGIEWSDTLIKQLGNRLVTLSEGLYFIPKFIDFQYPKWPNSKVKQQSSAIEILSKYSSNLTVRQLLPNSYDNDNGIEYDNDWEKNRKNEIYSLLDEMYLAQGLNIRQDVLMNITDHWFNTYDSKGWQINGNPIAKWQSKLKVDCHHKNGWDNIKQMIKGGIMHQKNNK